MLSGSGMTYAIKILLTVLIVIGASEAAKRFPAAGALINALPLMSLIVMCLLYYDTGDTGKVAALRQQVLGYSEPLLGVHLAVDDPPTDTELFARLRKTFLGTARRAEAPGVQLFPGVEQDDAPMT